MDKYIDVKVAEKIIWKHSQKMMNKKEPILSGALAAAIGLLDQCPAADVVPVVHSH